MKKNKIFIFVLITIAAIIIIISWRRPASKSAIFISPLKLSPYVSREQTRLTICGKITGAFINKVCQKKYDKVAKNDYVSVNELYQALDQAKNDSSLVDYDKYLLSLLVFATLPAKDSSEAAKAKAPERPEIFSNILGGKALAQELSISREEFKKKLISSFKTFRQNCPKAGDDAWILQAMCSEHVWINGVRQPIYSNDYSEAGGNCVFTDEGEKEAEKLNNNQSDIETLIDSKTGSIDIKQTSSQTACAFSCNSHKCPEPDKEKKIMDSKFKDYTESGYSGGDLLKEMVGLEAKAPAKVESNSLDYSEIGSKCEKVGAGKKDCSGNAVVTLICSQPTDCVAPKSSGCQGGCGLKCKDTCYSSGKCQPDPDLSGALQYSYVDEVYNNCIAACKAEVKKCYSACNDERTACEKETEAKKEEYKKCLEKSQWRIDSEAACDSGAQCVQSGDSAGCEPSANSAAADTPVPAGDSAGSFNDYMKCILAVVDIYPASDRTICLNQVCNGSERECLYDSGPAAKFQNCLDNQRSTHQAEIDAANNECERKYGANKSPAEPIEDAPSASSAAAVSPAENAPSPSAENEPIADPIGDNQLIKVAGAAPGDPLNEAGEYAELLKRQPALPSKGELLENMLSNYETGKPISVWNVQGAPEVQMPGSEEWVVLKKGDIIPQGARIQTGLEDDLLIYLPGIYVVKVRSLSDITFNKTEVADALLKGKFITHLDLRDGDVEVQVEQGTYQATMQVEMPQYVAGVRGTHFWVSYDETKQLGSVGVYEGEVAVDDLSRGTRTLLTPASDSPRVMVMPATASASVNNKKSAPLDSQSPVKKQLKSGLWWLIIIFILATVGFILHKTGKFQPMIKKILALIRKDDSGSF